MHVGYGKVLTEAGPGIRVQLTSQEVEIAIRCYLTAHCLQLHGDYKITIDNAPVGDAEILVEPAGYVVVRGKKMCGGGPTPRE